MATTTRVSGNAGNLNFIGTGEQEQRYDEYGGAAVTQLLPSGLWLTQHGRTYVASQGVVANAVVCVVDVPTTAAKYALYNGYAITTKTRLIIHRASLWLASGTADTGASLLVGLSSAVQSSAPTAATGAVIKSSSNSTRATSAIFAGATTLAGAAAWESVAAVANGASTPPGTGAVSDDLSGMFIVSPTYALGFAVLSGLGTTAKWGISIRFSEVELDLE